MTVRVQVDEPELRADIADALARTRKLLAFTIAQRREANRIHGEIDGFFRRLPQVPADEYHQLVIDLGLDELMELTNDLL